MTNEFDIIEHPMVIHFLKDLAKHDPLALVTITEGNIATFREIFGKSNGKTQRFEYWKRDHLGIIVIIYSDEQNTYYKIQYLGDQDLFRQDKKMGSYITSFLSKLVKDILQ